MLVRHRLLLVAALALSSSAALAAPPKAGTNKGYGNNNNTNNNNQNNTQNKVNMGTGGNGNQPATPVDDSPVKNAAAAANTAHDAQRKAETALNDLTRKLTNEYEQTPEMKSALDEVHAQQAAYNAASKAVTDKLASSAEYKKAAADKAAADAKVAKLRADTASPDDITAASNDALAKAAVVSKLQLDAVNADPNAVEARNKLATANQKAAELRKTFTDGLANNADWSAAKKAVDDAKDASKQADQALADARKNYAQQVQAARAR